MTATRSFLYRLTNPSRSIATGEDLAAAGLGRVLDLSRPGCGGASLMVDGGLIVCPDVDDMPGDKRLLELCRAKILPFIRWRPWGPGVEVGFVPGSPLPSPMDVVRRKSPTLPHHVVQLDDGEVGKHVPASWRKGFLAPVLVTAARDVLLDLRTMRWAAGDGWQEQPSTRPQDVRILALLDRLAIDVRADLFGAPVPDGHVRLDLADQREVAAHSLGLFYRVVQAECSILGLDHPAVVQAVLSIVADVPGLEAALQAAMAEEGGT